MELFKERWSQVLKVVFLIILPVLVVATLFSFGMINLMEHYGDTVVRVCSLLLLCVVLYMITSSLKGVLTRLKNGIIWLIIEPYKTYKKERKQ